MHGLVDFVDFLELAPLGVLFVELAAVVGEEEEGEGGEEDAPERTPQRYHVEEGPEGDPVVDDDWRQLEVEAHCIVFGVVVVGH